MNEALLWPTYRGPDDLTSVEAVPLDSRGLPATTYDLLTRAATQWPERAAVRVLPDAAHWQEPSTRTFAQLLADINRMANLLHSLGATRKSAIALLSPNCEDLLTATLAAELAGVAAPLNGDLVGEHIRRLLELSGARILCAASEELDARIWTTVAELDAEGLLDAVVVLRPTGQTIATPKALGATVVVAGDRTDIPTDTFVGRTPVSTDLAALFHTGGTTGTPKLAAHTHANEVADAWMIAAYEGMDSDAPVFAGLPLFHVNALIVTTLSPMFSGQASVWAGPLGYRDPHLYPNFWKIVEHYGIGSMSAVPTVYAVLAKCPVDADISTLATAAVGAAPLPPSVASAFHDATGVTLSEGYGLTEATCATARNFTDAPRPGTVGQRMPYQHVKAVHVDDNGGRTDLPAGAKGALMISGPTVFAGYVTGRDADGFVLDHLGTVVDGWLNTGDLGTVDSEGFVRLTGREKDLIIRGGHNIDPAIIENVLLEHPAVSSAGVVGEPDAHAGEVPVGFVTLHAGAGATADEIKDWAASRVVERAAAPRRVTVLDALPVTAVGKPFKPELRRLATLDCVIDTVAGQVTSDGVAVELVDGEVVARITVPDAKTEKAIAAALGAYTFTWTIETAR